MRVGRFRPANIRALEIWDWELSGRKLVDWVGADRVAGDYAAIVEPLLLCLAELNQRYQFEAVYLAGGLSAPPCLWSGLMAARTTFAVEVDPDGAFVGHRGGSHLLRQKGYQSGVIVDVGQTAVKVSTLSGKRTTRRRTDRIKGLSAAAFVSQAIYSALDGQDSPQAMVLALPCELGDDCVPGDCTYDWTGDVHIVPRILLDLPPLSEVLVLNDAELAAVTAQQVLKNQYRRVLVLTLGFGPGAALIEA